MSHFTGAELDYLRGGERRLARIATIGPDGTPHVTPVGHSYNSTLDTIDVGGMDLPRTKKYRDLQRNNRVAIVIDDVLPPWQPRGVEVRGHAETVTDPQAVVRIHPERIVSWGIESDEFDHRHARDASGARS